MKAMRRLMYVASLATAALLAGPAAAHNYHMGIADISYNARSGSTEIVHSYTAHDLATLLSRQAGHNVDLGQAGSEALLRRYTEKQFYLEGRSGKRLPMAWIGMKVDADTVVIFQEIAGARLAPGTRIHQGVLMDMIPEQKNTVNVQGAGAVSTLVFDRERQEQMVP